MLRTLRTRLFFSYVFVILVCLVVAAATLFLLWRVIENRLTYIRLADVARPTAFRVRGLIGDGRRSPEEAFQEMEEQADRLRTRILLLRRDGLVVADTGKDLVGKRLLPAPGLPEEQGMPFRGRYLSPGEGAFLYVAVPLPPPPGGAALGEPALFVAVGSPVRQNDLIVREIASRLLLAGAVALLCSVAVSVALSRSITRPLNQALEAMEAVAQGRYDDPLPEEGPQELRRLAKGVNQMAHEVQASRQAQRDFLANVSHEFKTPLTSIQGYAQAIVEGAAGDREAQKRAAGIIYEESVRMGRLVRDLLELARMDAGQMDLVEAEVDVAALVQNAVERMRWQAEEEGVRLEVDVEGSPRVLADGERLAQVLGNLLDNAIKHVPGGGEVRLAARREGDQVLISVTDTGPGIPAADLPRVFERFYQVDKSRSEGKAGAGLGLAIASELAQAMGGEIRAESVEGLGARFTVVMPALSGDQIAGIPRHKEG